MRKGIVLAVTGYRDARDAFEAALAAALDAGAEGEGEADYRALHSARTSLDEARRALVQATVRGVPRTELAKVQAELSACTWEGTSP